MKRFYKQVSISGDVSKGFLIELDGKPVKTQGGQLLRAPTNRLAEAIFHEWDTQLDEIKYVKMPLTNLLGVSIDYIVINRPAIEIKVLGYLDTDLICYRASHPADLCKKQAEAWDVWLEWFHNQYGAKLSTTTEIQALSQPHKAHEALKLETKSLDDYQLTIYQLVSTLAGSAILGLAFIKREITVEQLYKSICVEEDYKAGVYDKEGIYGRDAEELKKQNVILDELESAAKFLEYTRT